MGIRTRLAVGLLASSLAIGGGAVAGQESAPGGTPAMGEPLTLDLLTVEGELIGIASFTTTADGVTIQLQSTAEGSGSGLEPGPRGVHIHETGICDPAGDTPFESAGDHFNPTDASHGGLEDADSHAGDLGNLEVDGAGTFGLNVTTDKVSMEPGAENSLADDDGSAIMIHANADDLQTDPSGESGDPIACGVIFAAAGSSATPAADGSDATPQATPTS